MKLSRVCLVVVFNHRYDANIPKLRELYRRRFSRVHFLVPGYGGTQGDTTEVLESAHAFQGYFEKGRPAFESDEYSHYAFVGDDLVLASGLDEESLLERLGLDEHSGYIKNLLPLAHHSYRWARSCGDTVRRINAEQGFHRFSHLLPPPDEFARCFESLGLDASRRQFSLRNLRDGTGKFALYPGILSDAALLSCPLSLARALSKRRTWLGRIAREVMWRRTLPVPFLTAYSDFVVVPSESLRSFTRACEVFAAMWMWVEVAVPTALALTTRRVVTEEGAGVRGREIWSARELAEFEQECRNELGRIPQDWLYVHPIKLSRWTL